MFTTRRAVLPLMLSLCSLIFCSGAARAQSGGGSKGSMDLADSATAILTAGTVGGVIGLSTLSFYESPGDHWKNIFAGAAVGVIGAVVYLTVKMASSVAQHPGVESNLHASTGKSSIWDSSVPLVGYEPNSQTFQVGLSARF